MKSAPDSLWPRRLVMSRLAELAIILLLIILFIVGYWYVAEYRQEVVRGQQKIEQRPVLLQQYDQVQRDLRERQHDIERIRAQILTREEVGVFVNVLEELGRQEQVEVVVADIKEHVDEAAAEGAETKLLDEVHLEIRGVGSPVQLLRFLHEVEHSEYLVSLADWNLQVAPQGSREEAAVVPTGTTGSAGEGIQSYRSVLMADLVLMVTHVQD